MTTAGVRTLWITNDLPPRAGGIQQFVGSLLRRTWPDRAVVLGPAEDGAADHDREVPWRTERLDGPVLPLPSTLRAARRLVAAHRPEVVVLGAAWPLGHLAGRLRADGVPVVALTHGLEAGMCDVGLGWLVRRATRALAAATTISDYTERRLDGALAADRVERIPPGVDVGRFSPGAGGASFRREHGLDPEGPLVGCVSRLVARKGQDRLLDAWPELARRHPRAQLVLVGGGPLEDDLRRRAAGLGRVTVTGRIPWERLPAAYDALDVFAMPARTRWGGLDVEGLGIVYLEAQATAVPVVAGDSGGAPETVVPGRTGYVVPGRDTAALIDGVDRLLADADHRRRLGDAGRRHVVEQWSWDAVAERFRSLLGGVAAARR